jgi:peroxiredoxin (alkyl hydroperoxide reductase subunit C)
MPQAIIGSKAPLFSTSAVLGGKHISADLRLQDLAGSKGIVLFFYPKDFTYVCPTELWAFQAQREAFEALGVAVVGCSTDTAETHLAWLRTPLDQGGIQGITYPLLADESKEIAYNYGVLGGSYTFSEDRQQMTFVGNCPVAYRGTFFIDETGIIRHASINELSLGRNVQELLRIVGMWQHVQAHGEVCPAGWQPGTKGMKATPEGVADYMKRNN